MPRLKLKRAYDAPALEDGMRFLVDRYWPRGLRKERLMAVWLREVAPSLALIKWFGHQPELWDAFVARYHAELDHNAAALEPIRAALEHGDVTLLYAARDTARNNAVALRAYLEREARA
ncbi:MAG: DUF488 family protein [Chloroflexi bacterium]|nr:DUF488 family protein [Chloroflexota bacterium]